MVCCGAACLRSPGRSSPGPSAAPAVGAQEEGWCPRPSCTCQTVRTMQGDVGLTSTLPTPLPRRACHSERFPRFPRRMLVAKPPPGDMMSPTVTPLFPPHHLGSSVRQRTFVASLLLFRWRQRRAPGRSRGSRHIPPSALAGADLAHLRPPRPPLPRAISDDRGVSSLCIRLSSLPVSDGTHTAVATAQVSAAAMVHVPGGM